MRSMFSIGVRGVHLVLTSAVAVVGLAALAAWAVAAWDGQAREACAVRYEWVPPGPEDGDSGGGIDQIFFSVGVDAGTVVLTREGFRYRGGWYLYDARQFAAAAGVNSAAYEVN